MTATYVARASRQSIILSAVAGLHAGACVLIASGLAPRLIQAEPPQPPITVILPPPQPTAVARPQKVGPFGFDPPVEPMPRLEITVADEAPSSPESIPNPAASGAGSGPVDPDVDERAPGLQTRDGRLAALVDSCYPSTSRRLGEEGRAVARVSVGSGGQAVNWSVEQSSGFPRLDAAVDCVIRRLNFVAGRRDGRAVEATVLLPIVFRLD